MPAPPAHCPQCHAPIGPASPGGLCTRCLLARFTIPAAEDELEESKAFAALAGTQPPPPRIGDYELLEVIGRGGMGVVYKARQTSANRLVAVKLIAAGDLATPELIRRFKSEAETAASLEHPGIVPVYEVGESDGRHFFSMQWINGESLAARLNRIRAGTAPAFSEQRATELVESMARALHYAHQRGVLHRDIKPGNILLDDRDTPRLTDFGLAKLLRQDTSLTRTGGVLGTPAYMAPEQAAGRTNELTTAVDVYGLGAVLYELLTGTQPFRAASSYELIRKVIEEEPHSPASKNPRIGPDLETICLKCLEKDPSRRYPTSQALAEDLSRWRHHEPISARRASTRERLIKWTRRHPARAVFAITLALGSLVFIQQQWRHTTALRSERDAAREAQRKAEDTVLNQRLIHADRLLQFGKTAEALAEWARILHRDPTHPIAAARVFSTLSHRNLVLPAAGTTPISFQATTLEFSPDGTHVLCGNRKETALLDAATWNLLPNSPQPFGTTRASWRRDGRQLAIMGPAGTGVTVRDVPSLVPQQPLLPLELWSTPVFSPDGSLVAVAGGEGARIWIQNQHTGTAQEWNGDRNPDRRPGSTIVRELPRVLVPSAQAITSWSLDPQPRVLAQTSLPYPPRRLRTRPASPTLIVETEPSRCLFLDTESLQPTWPEIPLEVTIDDDLSPNGLLYASGQRERWGQLWDLTTGHPLGEPFLRPCLSPRVRFSPDGRHLALSGDIPAILLCDARDGRMRSRAFRHQAAVTHAEFSPDGQRLVTASNDGTAIVWNVASGERALPPLPHPSPVRSAQFVARGTRLVTIDTANTVRIWDAATGSLQGPPRTQPSFVHAAIVDATGRWLACCCGSGWNLYSLTADSPDPVFGETGSKIPSAEFTPDGQTLLTVSVIDGQEDRIQLWTPGEKQPRWTLPERLPYIRAAVTHDGRTVAAVGPTIRLWDTGTSRPLGVPIPRTDELWVATFRPDGKLLLTAGMDRKAQLWDARTGEPAAEPMLHESGVWQAQFSPDGTRILTSTVKGMARVWDVATGHPLTEPFPDHPVAIHIIMSPSTPHRFSPDGGRVVLPCADGCARFVELPPADPPPPWLADFVEAIAGQRVGTKGIELLSWSKVYEARDALSHETTGGRWLDWARWLLADRLQRPITPTSTRSTRDHVEELVRDGGPRDWVEALQLEPTHDEARSKLARYWLDHPDPVFPGRTRSARHLAEGAERP